MANNIDWGAAGKGALAGAATGASLGSTIPGVGTLVGAIGGAAIGGLSEIGSSYYENSQQQDAEERQEQRDIRAEQRANAEYDRRLADARKYEHPAAQAERLAAAGINPLSVMTNGGLSQVTTSQPSSQNTSVAKGLKARGSISDIISAQSIYNQTRLNKAEVENLDAQTNLMKNQASTEYEKGYQIFIDNCMQKVMIGDRGSALHVEEFNFKPNYKITFDDAGNVQLVQVSGEAKKTLQDNTKDLHDIGLEVMHFHSDVYGDLQIHTQSRWIKQVDGELSKLEGMNHELRQKLSTDVVTLYATIMNAMSNGKQADAATITALAKKLEADFKYNSEDGNYGTKWWIQTIYDGIAAGKDIVQIITGIAKMLPKAVVETVKEAFDGDGTHTGTTITRTTEM